MDPNNTAPPAHAIATLTAVTLVLTATVAVIVRPWLGFVDWTRRAGTTTENARAGAGRAEGLPQARWANAREVSAGFSHPGGIVLGELTDPIDGTPGFDPVERRTWKRQGRGALISMDPARGNGHVVVIAASAGGKTAGIVIPNILNYDGPLVVLDPKGDLYARTRAAREAKGFKARVIDAEHGFDPFKLIAPLAPSTPSVYLTMAKTLMPIQGRASDISEYFHEMACSLFAALMAHFISEKSQNVAGDISRFINRERDVVISDALEIAREHDLPLINDEMKGLAALDERTFPGVVKGISNKLAFVRFPDVASYGSSEESPEDHLTALEPDTDIFINVPALAAKDFSSFPRLLIGAMYVASELLEQPDRPRARRLFLIDEARVLGGMDALTNVRDAGRSIGMHLMLIYQSLGQLKEAWGGEAGADAWLDSCEARVVGAVGAPRTASDIVTMLGRRTVTTRMHGTSASNPVMAPIGGSVSSSEQEQMREVPLMSAATLSQLPAHGSVIFTRRSKPILATKALYFTRSDMQGRVLSPDEVADQLEATKRRAKVMEGIAAKAAKEDSDEGGETPDGESGGGSGGDPGDLDVIERDVPDEDEAEADEGAAAPSSDDARTGDLPATEATPPDKDETEADVDSPESHVTALEIEDDGTTDQTSRADPLPEPVSAVENVPDAGLTNHAEADQETDQATEPSVADATPETDQPDTPPEAEPAAPDSEGPQEIGSDDLTGTEIALHAMMVSMARNNPEVFEIALRTLRDGSDIAPQNAVASPPRGKATSSRTKDDDEEQQRAKANTPETTQADGADPVDEENADGASDIDPGGIEINEGEVDPELARRLEQAMAEHRDPHVDEAIDRPTPAAAGGDPEASAEDAGIRNAHHPVEAEASDLPADTDQPVTDGQSPEGGPTPAGTPEHVGTATISGDSPTDTRAGTPQTMSKKLKDRPPINTGTEHSEDAPSRSGSKATPPDSADDGQPEDPESTEERGAQNEAAGTDTPKGPAGEGQSAADTEEPATDAEHEIMQSDDRPREGSQTLDKTSATTSDASSAKPEPSAPKTPPKPRTARKKERRVYYNADDIRGALDPMVEDLFRLAFGEPEKPAAPTWRLKGDDSISMVRTGSKRGKWYNHKEGRGGTLLDLIAIHFCGLSDAGVDFQRVLAAAADYAGYTPSDRRRLAETRRTAKAARDEEAAREAEDRDAIVWALSQSVEEVAGSPDEAYLAKRGINRWPEGNLGWLPPLTGKVPEALLRSVHSPEHGALVVWARDGSGTITGGQRILITPEGTRVPKLPKPCFGKIAGFPARFGTGKPETPLIVAEGPETALSLWLAAISDQTEGCEAWAVFGISGFASAPLPKDRPVIFAPDQDAPDSKAAEAFRKAVAHHLDQGLALTIARPPEPAGSKRDFNDTLVKSGPEPIRTAIAAAHVPGPDDLPEEADEADTRHRKPPKGEENDARSSDRPDQAGRDHAASSTPVAPEGPEQMSDDSPQNAIPSAPNTDPAETDPFADLDLSTIEIDEGETIPWLDDALNEDPRAHE